MEEEKDSVETNETEEIKGKEEEIEEKEPKRTKFEPVSPLKALIDVDSECKLSGAKIYSEMGVSYTATMVQTTMNNNDKFYIEQVLEHQGACYVWSRWGRVDTIGQTWLRKKKTVMEGIVEFKKKFKTKTKNDWEHRNHFKKVEGFYDLLKPPVEKKVVKPCTLDPAIQNLMMFIFGKPKVEILEDEKAVEEHIFDIYYKQLHNEISVLDKNSDEFTKIDTWKNNCGTANNMEVFKLNREGEDEEFDQHKDITNRKLLWISTDVKEILTNGVG